MGLLHARAFSFADAEEVEATQVALLKDCADVEQIAKADVHGIVHIAVDSVGLRRTQDVEVDYPDMMVADLAGVQHTLGSSDAVLVLLEPDTDLHAR